MFKAKSERLIFERSSPGRQGCRLPGIDVPARDTSSLLPSNKLRGTDPGLPELSEPEIVRHFVNLSVLNHHIDRGFYPLGSCTMKYNPKVNEDIFRLPGFSSIHPLQPEETVQGALKLMYELGRALGEIAGLPEVSLQPSAGAQSELLGALMVRGYHEKKGNPRSKVLIPDSAHGTNPASVVMAGYTTVEIKSNDRGLVDIDSLRQKMDEEVACLILTNPNTLGLFESRMRDISEVVHLKGGLIYLDGANLNALLGIVKPGQMGFDIVHFNLHKTFSTPHGGGGPGGGGLAVSEELAPFLPIPAICERNGRYYLEYERPDSIGKVQAFYGNFGVMVKAYTYIRMLGAEGLLNVSRNAVINANYLMRRLQGLYGLPYEQNCMHEFVLSGDNLRKHGVRTLDVAKRLLDFGFHAPTIYFPLIVKEALMIEPTETESKETLDAFVEAMIRIAKEAEEDPEKLKDAPTCTPVRRLDDVRAARELDVRWHSKSRIETDQA